jgi:hypothetical protein
LPYLEIVALEIKPLANVLVMIVFALAAIGVAFAGYARVRTGRCAPSRPTTPASR